MSESQDTGIYADHLPIWAQPIDPRFSLAYSIRIDGEPHGKGSVRVVRDDEDGVRGIQAKKSKAYEDKIKDLAPWQRPKPPFQLPLDGPLVFRIFAVKTRPVSPDADLFLPFDPEHPEGRLFCPVTPDWDNIGKSVGDGLKKGRVIRDDARVVDGRVLTLWGAPGERPFVEAYVFAVARSAAPRTKSRRTQVG